MLTSRDPTAKKTCISRRNMNTTNLGKEKIDIIQSIIQQPVEEIHAPVHEMLTTAASFDNLSAIKLIMKDGTTVFFSANTIDLVEQVEVSLLDVTTSLEFSYYPGGPSVPWQPIISLSTRFNGLTVEHFRVLSASWQVATGSDDQVLYGSSPRFLQYSSSSDADTYNIEDGVILFCSGRKFLTICTVNSLVGSLNVSYSEGPL